MKIITKETYKCEYCGKLYQLKIPAIHHESKCRKNPDNWRVCHGCSNLEKKETLIYSGIDNCFDGEPINNSVDFLFCTKKQIFLYTPQNEIKGNYHHLDENGNNFENYPMPKECELKKFRYICDSN